LHIQCPLAPQAIAFGDSLPVRGASRFSYAYLSNDRIYGRNSPPKSHASAQITIFNTDNHGIGLESTEQMKPLRLQQGGLKGDTLSGDKQCKGMAVDAGPKYLDDFSSIVYRLVPPMEPNHVIAFLIQIPEGLQCAWQNYVVIIEKMQVLAVGGRSSCISRDTPFPLICVKQSNTAGLVPFGLFQGNA